MSTMLEQAIVDAAALRSAAIKSAEQVVVEQFSDQIKDTVERLLEQEETPEAQDADAVLAKDLDSQLPEAFHMEIDDDKILEIDLHSLEASDLEKEDVKTVSEKKIEEDVEELEEESVEIEESELEEIAESLKFDYEMKPDGGFANGQMRPPVDYADSRENVAELVAAISEYNDDLEEKNSKLKKENKTLQAKYKKLNEMKNELINTAEKIKEKFDEAQLTSGKLHYMNQTLMDDSLNERQKKKIVESIGEVSSLEQAKIVYETLQSTVGISNKKRSKSLSEVVSKRASSSILLRSRVRSEEKSGNNDFAERMKRLAGID
jgi:hypothetical protein